MISDTERLVEKSHRISLIFVNNLVVTVPPTALHVDVIFQIIDPPESDSRKSTWISFLWFRTVCCFSSPTEPDVCLIKRIIALEGDTVR